MNKTKWFLIGLYRLFVETFLPKKTNNDIIIENIMDDIHKMIALEEFSKKRCDDEMNIDDRNIYNSKMQEIKNDIILSLNGIEFFE